MTRVCSGYGLRVRVCADESLLDLLEARLPIGIRLSGNGGRVDREYRLAPTGHRSASGGPEHALHCSESGFHAVDYSTESLVALLGDELLAFATEFSRTRVFLHAGAVGWRGRALLVPGRSMSGKSTLVAALVAAGADYYSDEYAVLDRQGRVHPYARPLSLRPTDGSPPVVRPVHELGGVAGTKPLPVGAVILTKYHPGARWRPREVPRGQGAMALLDNAVAARTKSARVMEVLGPALAGAVVLRGARGEADDAAAAMLNRGLG